VLAQNKYGQLTLTSGQSAVAERGKAPAMRVVVSPRDAVQWALYYPPVIYFPEGVREDRSDPRFLAYNASQLLAVGRVDEADAEISRALRLEPNYSDALSLQAIIYVVQNERDKALSAAQQAVGADPNSATAQIALSYAQQASFNLEGARASVEKAVKLDPQNALAWARLAELYASFGELDNALKTAQRAEGLNPNLSRTQTVLGFAYLNQVKIKESKAAFEKAIELDQADPLPRLGLGLAKIRQGDLEEGRAEIAIAASLDPNNSLIRSYLGKAYYEEKRIKQDEVEYKIAKELDPKDPTPYFYDAIRKQTINRPVEALRDYQKAIELNDNRAVYRSKLNLDSDEAARSSSLARVYSDLGFQQLALVEGWKSVNTDPTNYSAHRFLADSYSARPRHEIARVSELLQSQLLQPTNITPIQPRLAESNLFLVSAQGPGSLSFNEFNPIFNRNGVAMQFSTLAGENDTIAGEIVLSGIHNKVSWSLGGTKFQTDGWRDNADQDDQIANAFVQYELTYKTSIQAEYRYRDTDRGDTQLTFFEDDFLPNQRQEKTTETFRLGFRHFFSPSTLIGNFSYQDLDALDSDQPDPDFGYEFDSDQDAYGSELQYLFRSQYLNFVTGAGYFDIDGKEEDTYIFFGVPDPPDTIDLDLEHYNVYLYSYINLLESLTLTIGGSGDFQDADDELTKERDQFNPKFGVTWNPVPSTTLRGAAFRTLKRTLITDQTVEPAQVAGFNQFFDEVNTTDYWTFGGALDQKVTDSIYGGVEYTYRDLNVPYEFFDFTTFEVSLENANWDEKIFRAYLFWAPHEWLAFNAEWLWERLEREEDLALGAKTVETNYFPLGINFFHPSGLSASLKGTYVEQKGSFERKDNAGVFESDEDEFLLVDAAVRYRFPKRYGFFSVGVSNLFDENFEHFDSDYDNPRFQPDRFFFARFTLAVP
jgi:tetratricopeptide (TPR) repeat protein